MTPSSELLWQPSQDTSHINLASATSSRLLPEITMHYRTLKLSACPYLVHQLEIKQGPECDQCSLPHLQPSEQQRVGGHFQQDVAATSAPFNVSVLHLLCMERVDNVVGTSIFFLSLMAERAHSTVNSAALPASLLDATLHQAATLER